MFSSNVGVIQVFSREEFNSVGLENPKVFSKIPRFLGGFKWGLYFSWFFFEKSCSTNISLFERNIGWLNIKVQDLWLLSTVQVKLTFVFWKLIAFWKSFQNQGALKTVVRPASEFWVLGTFSRNVKVNPGISSCEHNSFQRIFPLKFSGFYYTSTSGAFPLMFLFHKEPFKCLWEILVY